MSARNRELLTLLLAGLVASDRVRERVDRRRSAARPGVAPVRGAPRRRLPRRPSRRARHRPRRRSDAAAACRAPLRDRADLRLPHRAGGRAEAARLGRDRRPRLRARPRLAALRLPRPRALQVRLRGLGDRAPDAALRAGARRADQRRQALGERRATPVPAWRDREDLPRHLPRRVPPRQAGGARAGPPEGLRAAPC